MSGNRKISVAPMMAYTDRHFRALARIISPNTWLYTEMVTANEVLNNPHSKKVQHHGSSKPVALQLGGCDPQALALAAEIGAEKGYDEINLNVGCPSDRVQSGKMGACLMREPKLVAQCVASMQSRVSIPVTVKTRIGIDEHDSYSYFSNFIKQVADESGCQTFIIHARKAWLKGLSPKENREIPPLNYDYVYRLKSDYSQLNIILNGGIKTLSEISAHLNHIDGVMLGREAYAQPMLLQTIEKMLNPNFEMISAETIFKRYQTYIANEVKNGTPMRVMLKPLYGLYKGKSGAKKWRVFLNQMSESSLENLCGYPLDSLLGISRRARAC